MFEQVRQLLAHQFEVDENTITMDTNIADDLGADSLDVVELVMVDRGCVRHHDRGREGSGADHRPSGRGLPREERLKSCVKEQAAGAACFFYFWKCNSD